MDEAEIIIALILAIICAFPAGILIEQIKDYHKTKKYYDIIWKKSSSLKPKVLLGLRPFNSYYFQRTEDTQIANLLENGENILIVGSPLAGKTRATFQTLISINKTFDVIKPKNVEISPDSIHIPKHFRFWRKRLVLFDDIHEFASKGNFIHLLKSFHDNRILILATCRSGFEFENLEKVIDVEHYFNQNVIKIGSVDDKTGRMIAENNNIEWNEVKFNHTVGSIFVPLKIMEFRFVHELNETEKRILRTFKKLYISGIYNEKMIFPLKWIKILSKCYEINLNEVEWNSNLMKLEKLGFIETKYKGEKINYVQVEEVYLNNIITFEGEPRNELEIFKETLSLFSSKIEYNALIKLGLSAHEKGLIKDKRDFMQVALDSFSICLNLTNISENKEEYALLAHLIGKTYSRISVTKEDPKLDLEKSIMFLNKALEIRTKKKYPLAYASTQNILGISFGNLAKIENRKENLEKAIKCYEEALIIKTLEKYPYDYAEAANNIGTAYLDLAEEENTKGNLEKSIKYCKEALIVRTKEKYPKDWAATINNLANAYCKLASISEGSKNDLEKAIKYYQESLEVKTKEKFPIHYAVSQNNLGAAYTNLSKIEPKREYLHQAIEHIEEALKVRTKEKYPFDYASSIYNLGEAFMYLAQIENKSQNCIEFKKCYDVAPEMSKNIYIVNNDMKNCCEAKKYFDEALEIFKKDKYPIIYSMILEHFETLKGICKGQSD